MSLALALSVLAPTGYAETPNPSDRFYGVHPDNEVSDDNPLYTEGVRWQPKTIETSQISDRPVVYGYRGEEATGSVSKSVMYFYTGEVDNSGDHLVINNTWKAPSTTVFVRPWSPWGADTAHGVDIHSHFGDESKEFNLTLDSAFDIDIQGYADYTEGTEVGPHEVAILVTADSATAGKFNRNNIRFTKSVTALVENRSNLNTLSADNGAYGLSVADKNGGSSRLTFDDTVNMRIHSDLTRYLLGYKVTSVRAGTGEAGTHVRFNKDATFTVEAHKGGYVMGDYLYAHGWRDKRGASDEQKASSQDLFIHNAPGSTLTFKTMVDHTQEATVGGRYLIGGSIYAYHGGTINYDIQGKLAYDVQGEDIDTTGFYLIPKAGTIRGTIAELDLKVNATHVGSGNPMGAHGIYIWGQQDGVLDLVSNRLSIDVTSGYWSYGVYSGAEEATRLKYRVTDDMAISVTGTNYVRALNFAPNKGTLTWVSEKDALLKVRGTYAQDGNPLNVVGVYSILTPDAGKTASTEVTFQNLTIDTGGYGIWAQTSAGGTNKVTVNGAFHWNNTSGEAGVAPMVLAKSTDNAVSEVAFNGAITATRETLFAVNGAGAKVSVHSPAAQLTGYAFAGNEGVLDMTLTGERSHALMHLDNFLYVQDEAEEGHEPPPPRALAGTVNVALADKATWTLLGEASQINTLSLTTGGHIDMTQMRGTARSAMPLGQPYLYIDHLTGTGGLISLRGNTQTNLAQQLHIAEGSDAGEHEIDVVNAPNVQATGMPILLVVSETGATNPDNYHATFKEAHKVEVGELLYTVGNTDQVNDAATQYGKPERSVDASNKHLWYLFVDYPAPEPEPEPEPEPQPKPDPVLPPPHFTNAAKGQFVNWLAHYLAATREETLRERVGDVHTFMKREVGAVTPWAMVRAENWHAHGIASVDHLGLRFNVGKVGVDKTINPTHRLGLYFGYTDADANGMAPLNWSGKSFEVGGTWTALSEKGTYMDAKVRVGRTGSRFSTVDSAGAPVSAKCNHSHYVGASVEVGQWLDVTENVNVQPMGQAIFTHVTGMNATTSAGLRSQSHALQSLVTRLGGMVDARFAKTSEHPWTLYGKAYWEREWLATPEITFNEINTYDMHVRGSRLVYGLGLEGTVGKASSWHVDVERSTGKRLHEDWQINAGVRIPF